MGPAKALPTLNHLRQMLAGADPSLAPRWPGAQGASIFDLPSIDAVLGGGLARTELHELAPASPIGLAAATGFAVALAARAQRPRGPVLWIAMDLALIEAGEPYGPGLDLFGLSSRHLLILRVP